MKIKEMIVEEKEFPAELKKEANSLKKLGVESYEINYIMEVRFRENKIS